MQRSILFPIIGAISAGAAMAGDRSRRDGRVDADVAITVGEDGVNIEKK